MITDTTQWETPQLKDRKTMFGVRRVLGWIGFCAALVTPSLLQADELRASVDRDRLYANEAFKLELQAETQLDFNLWSIFNPREMEIPHPDTSPLEQSFHILDRNQHMSIKTTNGENKGTVTWTFFLAPLESGTLTIPPLTFQDLESNPLEIEVIPGVAPPDDHAPRAHLEVELSDEEVYVQQQVLLTQRVFYDPPLIGGELSAPEIPDALVKPIDKQREFRAERNGREWQVVERRFALVPQSPGTLVVPEQTFQARKRNDEGNVEFVHTSAPPSELRIKPPPASFSGDVWLPARDLALTDEWSDAPESLRAGDSVTRTIHVRALGVAPEALPRIDIDYPDSLREYPEPWESESRLTDDSIEARIRKQSALVPIQPGSARIPAVRIPWWDVESDEERVAIIEASEVTVEPAAGSGVSDSEADSGQDPPLTDLSLSRPPGAALPPLWFWLAVVLASGWLLTGLAWWRNRRPMHRDQVNGLSTDEKANRERFQVLCERAQNGEADTLTLLPQWASAHFGKPALKTVGDVTAYINDPRLTREIQALERHLFANPNERAPWHGDDLVSALRRVAGKPLSGA
ncbi:oxygen tolerance protein BatD [Halospina denitrificans]|uniref:Oxygen tolerance protein BatD n=1 Tax=Halospina denitrificans TaxID=332522 RepID=A0A4R7JR37_9GAMM|nr:BatD family protein [Halospina denitrificans]TDT39289.1 oxygen tolerance protein BatD [Halospina denitrificans]